jgi:prepilin-type N-terminal cleavage/methylation domain-containing protein/prepilin-type processing-associated H-X9-DG protein
MAMFRTAVSTVGGHIRYVREDYMFSHTSRINRGFTLVELLLVVVIFAILLALLVPCLNSALSTAKNVSCQNNFKQVGLLYAAYLDRYQQVHISAPRGFNWFHMFAQFVVNDYGGDSVGIHNINDMKKTEGMLICPDHVTVDGFTWYWWDGDGNKMSYTQNYTVSGKRVSRVKTTIEIMGESNHGFWGGADNSHKSDFYQWLARRHQFESANFLFGDLHVENWPYIVTLGNFDRINANK